VVLSNRLFGGVTIDQAAERAVPRHPIPDDRAADIVNSAYQAPACARAGCRDTTVQNFKANTMAECLNLSAPNAPRLPQLPY
jgi:hypothetical protein